MDDLISRQAAIEMVYKTACLKWTFDFSKRYADELVKELDALPSVQPEIIHCRDCRYMHEDTIFGQCWYNRTSGCSKVNKDDFCSRAERRTDD